MESHDAGPELDRLIAEKVMGWQLVGTDDHISPAHVKERRQIEGRSAVTVDVEDWDNKGPHPRLVSPDGETVYLCGCKNGGQIPCYSTEIERAWEVVERTHPNTWFLWWHDGYAEWACFLDGRRCVLEDCRVKVHAETAPLAICLAALAAARTE